MNRVESLYEETDAQGNRVHLMFIDMPWPSQYAYILHFGRLEKELGFTQNDRWEIWTNGTHAQAIRRAIDKMTQLQQAAVNKANEDDTQYDPEEALYNHDEARSDAP